MKRAANEIRRLSPAYFALVMATGIVSVAAQRAGFRAVAVALTGLNAAQYAVLSFLTIWRLLRYRAEFLADLTDHRVGPGFFTTVAGTCTLASQLILIRDEYRLGAALWVLGLVLWVGLTYFIFTSLTVKEEKPPLDQGSSGGWLLAVVATQSIAVSSALLAAHFEQPPPAVHELPGAVDVAVGRHDVHLDDLSDLLPLHVLQVLAR